mmetsp:Transcript_12330/g.17521  ORF Transcript_12330/g.17521 Transcript_12330/m.17521 type:complete len:267 (-) Transcript_12330:250-1050(-)
MKDETAERIELVIADKHLSTAPLNLDKAALTPVEDVDRLRRADDRISLLPWMQLLYKTTTDDVDILVEARLTMLVKPAQTDLEARLAMSVKPAQTDRPALPSDFRAFCKVFPGRATMEAKKDEVALDAVFPAVPRPTTALCIALSGTFTILATAEIHAEKILPGRDAKAYNPFEALFCMLSAIEDRARSTTMASSSENREVLNAEKEKKIRPTPATTRNADRLGRIAYDTVFRNASPEVRCTTSSPTTSVANAIEWSRISGSFRVL